MLQATLYKPIKGKLALTTPFDKTNRQWLTETIGKRGFDHISGGNWKIAASHFNQRFIRAVAARFGSVKVSNEVREGRTLCTSECANANVHTANQCECVCLGDNHGRGDDGWKHTGQRLLVRPGIIVLVTTVYRRS